MNKWLDGADKKDVADVYDVKPRTVDTYINRYAATGSILSPYEIKKKNGVKITRSKKFDDPEMAALAQDSCNDKPDRSLTSYSGDIFGNENIGICASRSTIVRCFSELGWT